MWFLIEEKRATCISHVLFKPSSSSLLHLQLIKWILIHDEHWMFILILDYINNLNQILISLCPVSTQSTHLKLLKIVGLYLLNPFFSLTASYTYIMWFCLSTESASCISHASLKLPTSFIFSLHLIKWILVHHKLWTFYNQYTIFINQRLAAIATSCEKYVLL